MVNQKQMLISWKQINMKRTPRTIKNTRNTKTIKATETIGEFLPDNPVSSSSNRHDRRLILGSNFKRISKNIILQISTSMCYSRSEFHHWSRIHLSNSISQINPQNRNLLKQSQEGFNHVGRNWVLLTSIQLLISILS